MVYIVMIEWLWDTCEIKAVFSTRDLAENYVSNMDPVGPKNQIIIEVWQIDKDFNV